MINPTGKKLEKLLFGIFDHSIEGIDRYNHNGSLWLIFTDEMRWVVEYTKSQTLWYNYHFFKQETEMVGLDCVDNKDLIQKWFESRFLNMGEVKVIDDYIGQDSNNVNDTIQKGVKETYKSESTKSISLRWAIQNGVKETKSTIMSQDSKIEGTIQNGVKEIQPLPTQDGNRDWGKYYHGKQDRTKPHTEYVKDVIKIGEKLNQDGI